MSVRSDLKANSAELLAAVSAILCLVSLGLPWWGIQVVSGGASFTWSLLSGPPPSQPMIIFDADRITQSLQPNYYLVVGLVLVTALFASVAIFWRRRVPVIVALIMSVLTDLVFFADIQNAVNADCSGVGLSNGVSCISGLVGSGSGLGSGFVNWGFQSGFYVFVSSGILLLIALIVRVTRTGEVERPRPRLAPIGTSIFQAQT